MYDNSVDVLLKALTKSKIASAYRGGKGIIRTIFRKKPEKYQMLTGEIRC